MFGISMQRTAYFFIQKSGASILHDNGKSSPLVNRLSWRLYDGYSPIAGGKAPVEHFTRAAAKEFSFPCASSVTAIGPGPMDTPFFYGQETPERVAFHKSQGWATQTHPDLKIFFRLWILAKPKGLMDTGQDDFAPMVLHKHVKLQVLALQRQ